jgi:Fe-S-cluster containining protein
MPNDVVTVRLRVHDTTVEARAEVPDGPTSVASIVPFLRSVTEAVVEVATDAVVASGKPISCRAGCGACCRQLVPISVAEAHLLAELVQAMPPARRAAVEARFAHALEALAAGGVLDDLRALAHEREAEAMHRVGLRYFAQGVACPFLEDESCSIHPQRPLACREYLVTSPPAGCAAPEESTIERVLIPRDVSRALYRLGDGSDAPKDRWVPLVLALEWVAAHETLPMRSGREIIEAFFAQLRQPDLDRPASGVVPAAEKE